MATTLITNIGELVTNDPEADDLLGAVEQAALVVEGAHVAWVGPAAAAPAADEMIDAGGRAVIPGFVDSHSHLVFAGDRAAEFAARMTGTPYAAGGIRTTVAATRAATDEQLTGHVARLVAEMRRQGTTTVEIKSGYGLTVHDEARSLAVARQFTEETTYLGAHVVPEGAEVTFQGGPLTPNTTYSWAFGDGAVAHTRVATHRYADNGLYIAKFTTAVNEVGGVVTRHFAAVRVDNVAASVDAGAPLTIDEGQEVDFVATFTDPGWPDTHTAVFDFGDRQLPAIGVVQEKHDAPLGTGTASAAHAYCDNGTYTVTVRVMDDDGGVGVDTRTVTVRNVPPTVDAGEDMFAYRCTPITLVARFTDPGWCDTHTGIWDFGDCTPAIPATVRERHEPPAGCGLVAATHRYECCGDFVAAVTVSDDDGGVGRDSLVVRVVDVVNGDFEGGFRSLDAGLVANGWEPYAVGKGAVARFDADEFVVHAGQRAQRVTCGGATARAGLMQHVGANRDWDYQLVAWFHAREHSGARYRLGIDPAGGTNPDGATVVWGESRDDHRWTVLAVRATATARRLTIFLEALVDANATREGTAWFDDVSLLPYPCPLGDAPPCRPPREREVCIDWRGEPRPRVIGVTFRDRGFTFTSIGQDPLRIVVWGPPANTGKLQLPRKQMVVELPYAASTVTAHVTASTSVPIVMRGRTTGGNTEPVASSGVQGAIEALTLRGTGITQLEFAGGGGEGLLVDLCIADAQQGTDAPPDTTPRGARHG